VPSNKQNPGIKSFGQNVYGMVSGILKFAGGLALGKWFFVSWPCFSKNSFEHPDLEQDEDFSLYYTCA
jgi:hypothetical protein